MHTWLKGSGGGEGMEEGNSTSLKQSLMPKDVEWSLLECNTWSCVTEPSVYTSLAWCVSAICQLRALLLPSSHMTHVLIHINAQMFLGGPTIL